MVSPRPAPTGGTDPPSSQATLADARSPQHPAEDREPARGSTIDRYVVLDRVGAGGMGVVYAAYDPDLDRKLALKLLRAGERRDHGADGTRMLREAQALAKLAHPNVVAVHDVGLWGERVWIAMEFVAGRTLAQWLEQPRGWAEVLDVLVPAGVGVAAAHAAGLRHRDLKPDNIMIGDDGRVRVMDFGLARGQELHDAPTEASAHASGESVLTAEVTRVGALVGTPAYMPPEHFAGLPVDAAGDQFSLCVTIWEALYGQRPFAGATLVELAANITQRPPTTSAAAVPGWLRRVVARGLAADPAERWPSVEALLAAVTRGRRRAARRVPTLIVVGAGALAVGALGLHTLRHRATLRACEDAAAAIAQQWPQRRGAVTAAIVGGGQAFAVETAERLGPWLDAYVAQWQTTRRDTCLAATEGALAADLASRADSCLELDRALLQAMLDPLEQGEVGAVRKAVITAASLSPPRRCGDAAHLADTPAPDPGQLPQVLAIEAQLAHAEIRDAVGDLEGAWALGEQALADAIAIGWPPLVARARRLHGLRLSTTVRHAEAAATLRDAYFEAARAHAPIEAARAASSLAYVVGDRLGRFDEARTWGEHARLMLEQAGSDDGLLAAAVDRVLSSVNREGGDLREAERLAKRSLAVREEVLGPEHPTVAESHVTLGNVLHARGDAGGAVASLRRALEINERVYGPNHPSVASSLNDLAGAVASLGDVDEATAMLHRAIAIAEAAFGPDFEDLANLLSTLASIYADQGRLAEAEALYRRALAIEERSLGAMHFEVAGSLLNLAGTLNSQGDATGAAELMERALAICEHTLDPSHPQIGLTLVALGNVRITQDRLPEAQAVLHRGLAVLEAAGVSGPLIGAVWVRIAYTQLHTDHQADAMDSVTRALGHFGDGPPVQRDHFDALVIRGDIETARGRHADAAATYRAVLATDASLGPPTTRIGVRVGLAAALLAQGERDDGLREARRARDELLATERPDPELLAEIDGMLAGAATR